MGLENFHNLKRKIVNYLMLQLFTSLSFLSCSTLSSQQSTPCLRHFALCRQQGVNSLHAIAVMKFVIFIMKTNRR